MIAPARFSLRTGGASYAIYLGHILILETARQLGMPGLAAELPFSLAATAYLLLMALILGYSVWHYEKIEKPLHTAFKRWAGIRTTA